jgi:HTH-type transcriptional regulator, transcriptional repressor of NAD biosynthesis genes
MKAFRHGLVVGKFYPFHRGHAHLIATALEACESVTVEVLASSVESIPGQQRAGWIRAEHPTARVVWALDDAPVDYASETAWLAHLAVIRSLLEGQEPVDAVFTSDDYGAQLADRMDATWVQVDPGRRVNSISGRAIRADVDGMWWALTEPAQRDLGRFRRGVEHLADPLPERVKDT